MDRESDDYSEEEYAQAMDRAVFLLSYRTHTRKELELKLKRSGMQADLVEKILDQCADRGYIDDESAARQLAGEMARKGRGVHRIRRELAKRGISEEMCAIASKAAAQETDPLEAARTAAEKKMRTLQREKDPYRRRAKLYRFLRARGFPAEIASKIVKNG